MTLSTRAQMKIMSYNIRYATENDGEDSWSKRKDHLTGQLKFYSPDIIGLQEALYEQAEHIKKNLKNHEYVGVGRNDGKKEGEFTAIFYNTEKFEVLENHTFWLSETPGEPSKGWDASHIRICTYALFQKKNSEEKFWIFNAHFDHKGDDAREKSAELILKRIQEANDKNLPVFLMGDLNLEPDTPPVRILSDNMQDSKKIATEITFGPEGTFNGFDFDKPAKRRIDYIFTSGDSVEVLKYGVLTDSKDLKYPSDHFPILILVNL